MQECEIYIKKMIIKCPSGTVCMIYNLGGAYILFSYTQMCNGNIYIYILFVAYLTPTEATAGIRVTARVAIVQCPWKYVH